MVHHVMELFLLLLLFFCLNETHRTVGPSALFLSASLSSHSRPIAHLTRAVVELSISRAEECGATKQTAAVLC